MVWGNTYNLKDKEWQSNKLFRKGRRSRNGKEETDVRGIEEEEAVSCFATVDYSPCTVTSVTHLLGFSIFIFIFFFSVFPMNSFLHLLLNCVTAESLPVAIFLGGFMLTCGLQVGFSVCDTYIFILQPKLNLSLTCIFNCLLVILLQRCLTPIYYLPLKTCSHFL